MLQRLAAEKVPSYHDAGSDCGSMTGYLPKPRKSQRDSSTHGQSTFPQKTDQEGHLRRPESEPRRFTEEMFQERCLNKVSDRMKDTRTYPTTPPGYYSGSEPPSRGQSPPSTIAYPPHTSVKEDRRQANGDILEEYR